jgi:hypothetical protein
MTMELQYLNTKDLTLRYRCSSRSIFRKMRRDVNPMPLPAIKNQGSSNLWLLDDIAEWDIQERIRTKNEHPMH